MIFLNFISETDKLYEFKVIVTIQQGKNSTGINRFLSWKISAYPKRQLKPSTHLQLNCLKTDK